MIRRCLIDQEMLPSYRLLMMQGNMKLLGDVNMFKHLKSCNRILQTMNGSLDLPKKKSRQVLTDCKMSDFLDLV